MGISLPALFSSSLVKWSSFVHYQRRLYLSMGAAIAMRKRTDMRYVEWMRTRGLSPSLIGRRVTVLKWAEQVMGEGLLTATPDDVSVFVRACRGRNLADSTIYVYAGHLSAFYGWATKQGLRRDNPVLAAAVPRRPRYLPRPISEEALIDAMEQAEPRVRVILALASMAGLRAVEISRLRREDVLDEGDRPALFIHGKGNRDRVVDLSPELLAELRRYGLPKRGAVIQRHDGLSGHVGASLVSSVANAHLHACGYTDSLHALRHFAGTTLYRETRDIRLVQDVLGHASPATSAIYADWSREAGADAMRRLASHVIPAAAPVTP